MESSFEPGRESEDAVAGVENLQQGGIFASSTARANVLIVVLLAEAGAFALLTGSGNIPEIVSTLFRALLTL